MERGGGREGVLKKKKRILFFLRGEDEAVMLSAIHRRRVELLRVENLASAVSVRLASPPFFKRKPRKTKHHHRKRPQDRPFFSRFCHLRVCKTVRAFVGFVCLLRPSFLGLQTASRAPPLRSAAGRPVLGGGGGRPPPGPARRRGAAG